MPTRRASLIAALLIPSMAAAAPADDARAALDLWAQAFNAGDLDRIVAVYAPTATVHGTTAPGLAAGTDALRAYFMSAFRGGTQVALGDEAVSATTLSPDHIVLAGFYTFTGKRPDGQAFAAPARYTFVVARSGGGWLIHHHHSSPRPRPQ